MQKPIIDGREVSVRDEQFSTIREDWNEYETASGVRVRVKTVVQKISRLLDQDGKPAFQADGDPHIAVRSQIQVVSSGGTRDESEVH